MLPRGGKDPFILHYEYSGCRCTGYLISHGISRRGIDHVIPRYYRFSTRRRNVCLWEAISSKRVCMYESDPWVSGTANADDVHSIYCCNLKYRKTSNLSRTFVGNNIVDNSDVVGAAPVALLQLHLHSQLNTWVQWIERRQLREDTRNI